MNTDLMQVELGKVSTRAHRHCIVCGSANDRGLHLEFTLTEDGAVVAVFDCLHDYQGYPNVLHGGVVSSLLDGAMTNCLFAHGYAALTAELNVRFRHPVKVGKATVVRAWIERSRRPLHRLRAECSQEGMIMATAYGRFMEHPALSKPT